jgi:hypothetical protein
VQQAAPATPVDGAGPSSPRQAPPSGAKLRQRSSAWRQSVICLPMQQLHGKAMPLCCFNGAVPPAGAGNSALRAMDHRTLSSPAAAAGTICSVLRLAKELRRHTLSPVQSRCLTPVLFTFGLQVRSSGRQRCRPTVATLPAVGSGLTTRSIGEHCRVLTVLSLLATVIDRVLTFTKRPASINRHQLKFEIEPANWLQACSSLTAAGAARRSGSRPPRRHRRSPPAWCRQRSQTAYHTPRGHRPCHEASRGRRRVCRPLGALDTLIC